MKILLRDRRKAFLQWLALWLAFSTGLVTVILGPDAALGFLWACLAAFLVWLGVTALLAVLALAAARWGGPFG